MTSIPSENLESDLNTFVLGHTLSTNRTSVETGWSSCWWSEILLRSTPCTRKCQTNKPLIVHRMERHTVGPCADWQEKHEMLQRRRSKWHGTHGKRSQMCPDFQVWKRVTPTLTNTRRKEIHWRIPEATALRIRKKTSTIKVKYAELEKDLQRSARC